MTYLKKIFLSSVILTLGLITYPAFAEQVERVPYDRQLVAKKSSTNDEVGVAFLKTANNYPDFNKIVASTDAYKSLDPLAQKDFQSKMVGKLQNSYLAFSPQNSDLIIRVKADVLFTKLPNGEGSLKMRTLLEDPVYFPFYFGGYPIALIIKDMEAFRNLSLSKQETDMVYTRLSLDGSVTLLLQVYPIAADDTSRITLDNIEQYPLLSEIGYIGMLNDQAEQIWAWRNSKYVNKKVSGGDARPIIELNSKK
jgi:hypothetical protein